MTRLRDVIVQLASNGSLASLLVNGAEWSSGGIGGFVYRTYNDSDWVGLGVTIMVLQLTVVTPSLLMENHYLSSFLPFQKDSI